MQELETLPNVRRAASILKVPQTLKEMGIIPDMSYQQTDSSPKIINMHRAADGIDYYYIYNRGFNGNSGMQYGWRYGELNECPYGSTTVDVQIQAKGKPYKMDAWTGAITPITDYKESNGIITVPVTLAGNESTIIAIDPGKKLKATHEESKTGDPLRTIRLTDWKLDVELWSEGDTAIETNKNQASFNLGQLKCWHEIEGLELASGIGTYTTDFKIYKGEGVIIDLGIVNYSYRLWINDSEVICSQTNTQVDVSQYVNDGMNTIKIVVASSLNNAIKACDPNSKRTTDHYGLIGKDGAVEVHTFAL